MERQSVLETVLEAQEVEQSLLDTVIEHTPKPEAKPIPAGYELLPAGVERLVRVNKDQLHEDPEYAKLYIVVTRGQEKTYKDVKFQEIPVFDTTSTHCCGVYHNSVHLKTSGPLLVKE